jgi:hypothetical protein
MDRGARQENDRDIQGIRKEVGGVVKITGPQYSTLAECVRIALVVGIALWVAFAGIRLYAEAIVVLGRVLGTV